MSAAEMLIDDKGKAISVVDKSGRRFVIRPPTALDTLRLFKAAGPILSQNEPWLAMASLACSVMEINGVPIPAPTNESQIEGMISRLGDDGLVAIAASLNLDQDSVIDEDHVGNSHGTLS